MIQAKLLDKITQSFLHLFVKKDAARWPPPPGCETTVRVPAARRGRPTMLPSLSGTARPFEPDVFERPPPSERILRFHR